MSVMRIKRGLTGEWELGPQLIDLADCAVNGKDSTIYCAGNTIKMNIFTTSAENFSTLTPSIGVSTGLEYDKHYGLQIFHHSDYTRVANTSKDHRLTVVTKSSLPSGCSVHICYGGQTRKTLSSSSTVNLRHVVTIPAGSDNVGIIVAWDSVKATPSEIELYISMCCVGVYDTLLPGQLGCEYKQTSSSSSDTAVFLKVGTPKYGADRVNSEVMTEETEAKAWDKIPYVGQVLPSAMYGTTLPSTGVQGQIFYLKVT